MSTTPEAVKALDRFLHELRAGVLNCQSTGIFFAQVEETETYISCFRDSVEGVESTCGQFQRQGVNRFTWFMPQIYSTQDKSPEESLIISDYHLIPDTAPLKSYYPPNFISVGDYVLWNGPEFIGWVGILSTQTPIHWETHKAFILHTIEKNREILTTSYYHSMFKVE